MKTESILRTLEGLYYRRSSFTEQELKRIDTIVVNRMDYDGSILNVDFNDLKSFVNLFSLTINGCIIDNSVFSVLKELPNLKKLVLYDCDIIENIYSQFNELKLKELIINNTNIDISSVDLNINRLTLEGLEFKIFNFSVNTLDVRFCEIYDAQQLLSCKFNEAIISFKLYDANKELFDNSNRVITVMEDNGQFVYKKVGY